MRRGSDLQYKPPRIYEPHLFRASGCSSACTQSSATSARGMLRGDSASSSSSTPSTSRRSPPCHQTQTLVMQGTMSRQPCPETIT